MFAPVAVSVTDCPGHSEPEETFNATVKGDVTLTVTTVLLKHPPLAPTIKSGPHVEQHANASGLDRHADSQKITPSVHIQDLTQDKLLRSFPTFMTRLQDPPGLPNLHIAVVSQDMGAGDGSIASCDASGGKNGIFQYTSRGACTTTSLKAGATYIANVDGVTNYTGNVGDVFSCIAALGETGCGFEHQFAAITRALGVDGRGAAPPRTRGSCVRTGSWRSSC